MRCRDVWDSRSWGILGHLARTIPQQCTDCLSPALPAPVFPAQPSPGHADVVAPFPLRFLELVRGLDVHLLYQPQLAYRALYLQTSKLIDAANLRGPYRISRLATGIYAGRQASKDRAEPRSQGVLLDIAAIVFWNCSRCIGRQRSRGRSEVRACSSQEASRWPTLHVIDTMWFYKRSYECRVCLL